MTKTQGNFRLRVVEGEFTDSQIVVMLGENGTGKTTFIRMLVNFLFLFLFFGCCGVFTKFVSMIVMCLKGCVTGKICRLVY